MKNITRFCDPLLINVEFLPSNQFQQPFWEQHKLNLLLLLMLLKMPIKINKFVVGIFEYFSDYLLLMNILSKLIFDVII